MGLTTRGLSYFLSDIQRPHTTYTYLPPLILITGAVGRA